eukprot:5497957-Heterocapsa_arctica.AAC.1
MTAVKFDASFFNDSDGLASVDVRTLCRVALGSPRNLGRNVGGAAMATNTWTAEERLRAMQWLSKFFPREYGVLARDAGCDAGSVGLFWAERRKEAMMEGVKKMVTVCCRTLVSVRAPLRYNGRPETFLNPVLPVFEGEGSETSLRQVGVGERRKEHGKGLQSHGSSLFWLPVDFLCMDCQKLFLGGTALDL